MKNGTPGLFSNALTPLALALLVLGNAVIHPAQPGFDDAGLASVFNGRIGMQVPKGAEFAKQQVRFRKIRVKELKSKPAGTALDYQGRRLCGRRSLYIPARRDDRDRG